MKVKELIDKLKDCDQESEVFISDTVATFELIELYKEQTEEGIIVVLEGLVFHG